MPGMAVLSNLISASSCVWAWGEETRAASPFTTFVFVGSQSLGKSALVERCVKFPMNIIKADRATKRPLYVSLEHSPDQQERKSFVRSSLGEPEVEKKTEDVLKYIEEENAKVESISSEPLFLRIESSLVDSIQFVDLPGLELNQTRGENESVMKSIKDMIREFAQKENHLLVVLEKATTQHATSPIIQFLNENVDNWKANAILALTFADDLYKQDSQKTVEATVRDRLNDYQTNGLRAFLVCNTPTKEISYQGRLQNLKAQSESEEAVINEAFKCTIQKPIPKDIAPHVGFVKLQKEMTTKYTKDCIHKFLAVLPELEKLVHRRVSLVREVQWRQQRLEAENPYSPEDVESKKLWSLQDRVNQLESQSQLLSDSLAESDPEQFIINLRHCFFEEGDAFCKLIDSPSPEVLFEDDITDQHGLSVADELNQYKQSVDQWQKCDPPVDESFSDAFASEGRDQNLKLLGGAAYDRMLRTFLAVLLKKISDLKQDPKFCKDAVCNAMGAGAGHEGNVLAMDPAKARFAICKYALDTVIEPAGRWFLEYACLHFLHTKRIAHSIWSMRGGDKAQVLTSEPRISEFLQEMSVYMLKEVSMAAKTGLHTLVGVLGARYVPNITELLSRWAPGPVGRDELLSIQAVLKAYDCRKRLQDKGAGLKVEHNDILRPLAIRLHSHLASTNSWADFQVVPNSFGSFMQVLLLAVEEHGPDY